MSERSERAKHLIGNAVDFVTPVEELPEGDFEQSSERIDHVTSWEYAKAQGSWALAEAAYEALLTEHSALRRELEMEKLRNGAALLREALKDAHTIAERREIIATLAATEPAQPEEERCGNTIHSDYVTDHRCRRERGHSGDCLFGSPEGADPGVR